MHTTVNNHSPRELARCSTTPTRLPVQPAHHLQPADQLDLEPADHLKLADQPDVKPADQPHHHFWSLPDQYRSIGTSASIQPISFRFLPPASKLHGPGLLNKMILILIFLHFSLRWVGRRAASLATTWTATTPPWSTPILRDSRKRSDLTSRALSRENLQPSRESVVAPSFNVPSHSYWQLFPVHIPNFTKKV